MQRTQIRAAALCAVLLAATTGAALAQTAPDGSTSPGGSPGTTTGQTTNGNGNVMGPYDGTPLSMGREMRARQQRGSSNGVRDPAHTGNGPTTSNGVAGEAPSSAPENH